MTDTRAKPVKKKVNLTVTISPHLYDWMTTEVEKNTFTSYADAVSIAVAELKTRIEGCGDATNASEEVKNAAIEAIEAVKKAAVSNENSTVLLINWVTTHPEFIEEFNDFIRKHKGGNVTTYRKVTFE